jgi:hypothetical protein
MEDFSEIPFAAGTSTREDTIEVLEYIWCTVVELIKAIDRLNRRV